MPIPEFNEITVQFCMELGIESSARLIKALFYCKNLMSKMPVRLKPQGRRRSYWANRKNCCVPEMGLVMVYCPLFRTGAGRLVVQIPEVRSVADCKVRPARLVGQVRINAESLN
jgi:hypothetical protein